jgi:hypothetical protein
MRRGWVEHSADTPHHGRRECTSMIRKRSRQAGREEDWRRLSPLAATCAVQTPAIRSQHTTHKPGPSESSKGKGEAFRFQTVTAR